MHTFIIDTNVASYLMKLKYGQYKPGSTPFTIASWYNQTLTGSELAISFATKAELQRGLKKIEGSDAHTRIQAMLEDFYSRIYICQSDEAVNEAWATLCSYGEKAGKISGGTFKDNQLNDLWIAATAIAYDLHLVGHDKDFLWMTEAGLTLTRYPEP